MSKKISVIVPSFNVEQYLEDCLNSLVKQTIFYDLEIVCIDDGSTDNTIKILEQYKLKYSNIIVVSQDNQGQSSARNAGLKLATGKYIGFIDSDDIINEVYYENLLDTIEKHQADLVVCKLVTLYDNGSVDETNAREYIVDDFVKIDSNFDDKIKLFLNDKLSVSPCNKLIKRTMLQANNTSFSVGLYNEDMEFGFDIIEASNVIVKCEESIYYYRQRSSSTTKLATIRVLDMLKVTDNIVAKLNSKYPNQYKFDIDIYKLLFCVYLTLHRARNANEGVKIEVIKEVHNYTKDISLLSILKVNHSLRKKVLYVLSKYFPFMLKKLLK